MKRLKELLDFSLKQREYLQSEGADLQLRYMDGRISAIQDCISLLAEFERDIRFRTLGDVDAFIESLEGQYYEDEPFVTIRNQLKEMI